MVESVKHCADLDNALASVANALTDDGVCYIVEDIYDGSHTARAQRLADDWHLKKLWGLSDFQQSASLAGLETQVHSDLTDFMNIASRGVIATKLGLFSLFSRFSQSSVMPIYRGGFILDWLYAKKQMRYQLLALRKRPVDNASGFSQQGSDA